MPTRVNRHTYEKMIQENIEWLKTMPRTLERDHILQILDHAVEYEYGQEERDPRTCTHRGHLNGRKTRFCHYCGYEIPEGFKHERHKGGPAETPREGSARPTAVQKDPGDVD